MSTAGAAAIAAAELKVEWRTPIGFVSAALFSFLVLLTQHLVFPGHLVSRPEVAFAAFFISAFFAALLAETSRIARDGKTGAPCLLALSTTSSAGLFMGKTAVPLGFISLVELGLSPFLAVLYNLPMRSSWAAVAVLCLLANLSLSGLTTLLGVAASSWKGISRALSLPLIILPLALPVLATAAIGAGRTLPGGDFLPYAKLLLAAAIAVWTVGPITYGRLIGRG